MVLPYLCNAITRKRPLERDTTVLLKFQKSFKKIWKFQKCYLPLHPQLRSTKS